MYERHTEANTHRRDEGRLADNLPPRMRGGVAEEFCFRGVRHHSNRQLPSRLENESVGWICVQESNTWVIRPTDDFKVQEEGRDVGLSTILKLAQGKRVIHTVRLNAALINQHIVGARYTKSLRTKR